MKELEMKELVEKSEKLAKINDLWYFVKSKVALGLLVQENKSSECINKIKLNSFLSESCSV